MTLGKTDMKLRTDQGNLKFKTNSHTLDNDRTIQREERFLIIWNDGPGAFLRSTILKDDLNIFKLTY